jgi:O-antigen/teichoic acid export membrane protein
MVFLRPAGIRVKVVSPSMLPRNNSGGSRHFFSSQGDDSLPTELRVLLGYGLPLYLAEILSTFVTQYQSIVLAHFASNVEIGNFGAMWS